MVLGTTLITSLTRAALASVLFIALSSCRVDPSAPRWAPAEHAAGAWTWVSSLDVKTTQMHTPVTDGFTAELVLVAETARTGTFTYRRAGAEAVRGHFSIASEDAPGGDFITVDPGFDFLSRNAWLTVARDTLRLGGVFENGYQSTYARAPAP